MKIYNIKLEYMKIYCVTLEDVYTVGITLYEEIYNLIQLHENINCKLEYNYVRCAVKLLYNTRRYILRRN